MHLEWLLIGLLASPALVAGPMLTADPPDEHLVAPDAPGAPGDAQGAAREDGTEGPATPRYSLRWVTIGSGGQSTATNPDGGAVDLHDSIGQAVAGTAEGGRFRLKTGISFEEVPLFADGFETGDTSAWGN